MTVISEIASKHEYYQGWAVPLVLLGIVTVICAIWAIAEHEDGNKYQRDKAATISLILLSLTLFCATMVHHYYTMEERTQYRVHVNDNITVGQIKSVFEIADYDRDNDIWILIKKEDTVNDNSK